MTKRLAFIRPKAQDKNFVPPLGVLIMASIMEKEGWTVRFFDEYIEREVFDSLIDFCPSIIGITCVTANVLRGRELAGKIKKELPGIVTVFGGAHPTFMPEEVLGWDEADFVIIGEGEYPLRDLCNYLISGTTSSQLETISNICYKRDGKIIKNKIRSLLSPEELDGLPNPAFHLLNIEKVFRNIRHGLFQKGRRILPIMASRGCPNHCMFCFRMMGSEMRYRNYELVLREIEDMISDYGVDEIWFEDDNFTADKNRAHILLDLIIERNYGIYVKFANGIRADSLDKELLEKMKKAGCYSISFGIESGSPKTLKLMRKHLSLDKVRNNVKIAKSMGFLVGLNCIIGYPGETIGDINVSLDYMMELDPDSMAIVNLIPFPGTEVRNICVENGYLTKEASNWNNYIFDINNPKILIETELLNGKAIKGMINHAYRRMYLRPQKIYNIIRHMKPGDIIEAAKVMLFNN
ncbi:MAG: radical SAM protein [Candidatus Omnitrophota bacterium]